MDAIALEKEIRKVQKQIDDVEEELKRATKEVDVAYCRNEKLLLRKEEEQLREEKLLLLKARISGPSATPSNVDLSVALRIFDSFDSVPTSPTEVNLLTELLKRPLVRKIPIYGDPDMVSSYGQILEASKDEVAPKLLQFFRACLDGPPLDSGSGEVIASTYWNYVFSLMENIGKDKLELPISTFGDQEDISSSVNHTKKRRDLFVNLNGRPGTGGVPVLLAEHKDKLVDAKSALTSKHRGSNASVYGNLGYLLGYAAADSKVQFYLLPVQEGIDSVSLLPELDLRQRADRTTVAIVFTNILRWLHSIYKLQMLCSTGIPFLVSTQRVDPWRLNTVTVHIGLHHVMKKFSLPCSVYDDFKELYSYLHGDMIPHAARVKKVLVDGVQLYHKLTGPHKKKLKKLKNNSETCNIELRIEPVGCLVDPATLSSEMVVQMTREVLVCLEALHERGFCHYDVRLTNIILWERKFYLIDFELAGKTNSQIKLELNFPGWDPKFKRSYDVKNDLYMLGKHVIKECCNSPTELKQLGEDLVDCKWATAKDAKERLLDLCS